MKAGWTISAVLHAGVLAWGLVAFATRPLNTPPPEFLSTDIISAADFSQITQGVRTAPKAEVPKPLVEKIGDDKPVENPTAKVVDKPEIVPTADQAQPKPEPEKKAEPKPPTPQPPGQARAEAGLRQGAGAEGRSDRRGAEERQQAREEAGKEGRDADAAEKGRAAEAAAEVRRHAHRGAARQARCAAPRRDRQHA